MAHRDAEYRELCSLCDEPAAGPCVRCGALYSYRWSGPTPVLNRFAVRFGPGSCTHHAPADDRRCDDCEAEHQRQVDVVESEWSGMTRAVVVATLLCTFTAAVLGLGWACVGIFGAGAFAARVSVSRERRGADKARALSDMRGSFLAGRTRLLDTGEG